MMLKISLIVLLAALLSYAQAGYVGWRPYDWRWEFNKYWDPYTDDAIYNSYFTPAIETYLYNQGVKSAAVDAVVHQISALDDPVMNRLALIGQELANPLTFLPLGSTGAFGFGWDGWDLFGGPFGGWRVGGLGFGALGYGLELSGLTGLGHALGAPFYTGLPLGFYGVGGGFLK